MSEQASNPGTAPGASSPQTKPRKRLRKTVSCEPCRAAKMRCDRQLPCSYCLRRNHAELCRYSNSVARPTEPGVKHNKLHVQETMTPQSDRQHPNNDDNNNNNHDNNTETSSLQTPVTHPELNQSLPETAGTRTEGDALLQRPTDQIGYPMLATQDPFCQLGNFCFPFPFGPSMSMDEILSSLPSNASSDYLITQYFLRVSPFFHVLHGPTFQKQYQAFVKDPSSVDFSWLALLFIMHSITINTMEDNDPILTEVLSIMPQAGHASAVSYHYRVMAMLCLCRDNFMVNHRLSTLEALLILAYSISHNESVEGSWTLLGIALNISIALRCNSTKPSPDLNCIDIERRRRCWAGILMLHTYQAILFTDVDMSFLNTKAVMPADVDDADILEDKILNPSRQPTQMSAIRLKIQLFQLTSRICQELQYASGLSQERLEVLDAQVSAEQHHWDSIFLVDGCPSLLDTSSYAHWCVLQLYAHQLFLLLHRPFSRADAGPRYSAASRAKCIASSATLLDIHRQLFELPRLRHYRWYSGGMSCFCALHGAVTLASCLLHNTDEELDATPYRVMFDKAVVRIQMLQDRSPICVKAYPVLQRLQNLLSPEMFQWSNNAGQEFGNTFDNWINTVEWLNPESVNWEFWDGV